MKVLRALIRAATVAVKTATENSAQQEVRQQAGPRGPEKPAAGASPTLLPRPPARRLAIVACMDTRQRIERTLGLKPGDAHMLRNAGGIVTDDVLRSLLVSHHLLGTREVFIINHTDCGMMAFTDEDLRVQIQQKMGTAVSVSFGMFRDPEENVRRQIERVRSHPWLPATLSVRGFVHDLQTGALNEVVAGAAVGGEPAAAGGPQRVGGRLQRERLERTASPGRALPFDSAGPSDTDFRRKTEAMQAGEPEALRALPASAFDLEFSNDQEALEAPPDVARELNLTSRDVLRALVLGEVFGEPKGRNRPRK